MKMDGLSRPQGRHGTAEEAMPAYQLTSWDAKFLKLAMHIASWSKDQSSKVGAVIVGPDNEIRATGYNGFPRGACDTIASRNSRPDKYLWTEHAERNAIYNAARVGIALDGCSMYLPWFPCVDCARAIVQTGIKILVAAIPDWNHQQWGLHFKVAKELFDEVDIELRLFDMRASFPGVSPTVPNPADVHETKG
jgi:dCMP deaminase